MEEEKASYRQKQDKSVERNDEWMKMGGTLLKKKERKEKKTEN